MSIASQGFLILFLPSCLLLYYAVFRRPRGKLVFLALASYAFYALAGWKFVLVLLGLSSLTFWLAKAKRVHLGILVNLLALGVFKYWNFGLDTVHQLAALAGINMAVPLLDLGLPLGISFYVFRHIGYLVDVKRAYYPPTRDALAFMVYCAFFPQIGAGPISNFNQIRPQLESLPEKLTYERAYTGLTFLAVGVVKKALIANLLAGVASRDTASLLLVSGAAEAWYLVLAYAMQLYFDFSGYTDMALGLGLLFGVQLPANFNNPYLSATPSQFWERWHISLSIWFRHYLFFPLSRSLLRKWGPDRKGLAQSTANLVTMGLVGLWHGAGWTYLLWGLYHGLALNLGAWLKASPRLRALAPLGRVLFLLAVLTGWAIFLSPDLVVLGHLLSQLFGGGGLGSLEALQGLVSHPATPVLLIALGLAFCGRAEAADIVRLPQSRKAWFAVAMGVLAVVGLFFLGMRMDFIYVSF